VGEGRIGFHSGFLPEVEAVREGSRRRSCGSSRCHWREGSGDVGGWASSLGLDLELLVDVLRGERGGNTVVAAASVAANF
jgi:hypothetical protein